MGGKRDGRAAGAMSRAPAPLISPAQRPVMGSILRAIEGRSAMTDLERLGLALVGFAVAVVAAGVLLGLIGAWITRR